MLTVLSFCHKDRDAALKLLEWIEELGCGRNHEILLTFSMAVQNDGSQAELIESAKRGFSKVWEFPLYDEDERGWPFSANHAWGQVVRLISNPHPKVLPPPQPWLWLESDSIPLTATAFDQIEAEYKVTLAAGKFFMGADVNVPECKRHMSGIAVYPLNPMQVTPGEKFLNLNNEAWDTYFAPDFLPHTQFTKLIQHVFWKEHNPDVAPTFPDQESLSFIHPEAVLFHRNKTGDLIDRLREKKNGIKTAVVESLESSRGLFNPEGKDKIDAITAGRIIHTYFDPVPEINQHNALELIELWKQEWAKRGWNPVVLGDEDARKHPDYAKAQIIWHGFPCQNPRGYDRACQMRHLAMAAVGGGWLADFDLFPIGNIPDPDGDVCFFSGNAQDPRIPCLVYGSKEGFEFLVHHLMSTKPDNNKHWSDMKSFGKLVA